jgi:hypothetical protein
MGLVLVFIGVSLGNHYLFWVKNVWLREVKTWLMSCFCTFFSDLRGDFGLK